MKKEVIITLKNNEEYIVLEEITHNNKKYYMGMKIKEKGKIETDKITFFLSLNTSDNELYVAKINDIDLVKILIKKMKK